MFKKVPTDMNFVSREQAMEQFWKEQNIFQ